MKHAWVEIDLKVLESNIRAATAVLRSDSSLVFVVKANAYGHGLVPVAQCAAEVGVKWFAVAYVEEAVELRRAVPDANILVLGVAEPNDVPALLEHRITPMLVSAGQARVLGERARAAGKRLPVHLKIDTGMGRLGFAWDSGEDGLGQALAEKHLEITGICTHFAAVKPTNLSSAWAQMERFMKVIGTAEKAVGHRLFRHVSSSRAFLYISDWDFDAVRVGIALYGYGAKSSTVRVRTKPILSWKTRVIQVKKVPAGFPIGYYSSYTTPAPTSIATLCVGYTDGYPRLLSNKGHVLIRGRRCPVVGRVSMNWVTVDVGPLGDVREGDEVVLIGEQGSESVWADELATVCGTIPYEILTDINPMLERRYRS